MSRAENPLIAINGLLIEGRNTQGQNHKLELATRYAEAVLKNGGIPLAIPPVGGPGDVDRLLDQVDGLLLSGGDDFDTERLGRGPTHPAATPVPGPKQDWDFVLAHKALERRLPVLGICYGMQLLGMSEGAELLQHLPEDRPDCQDHTGNLLHAVSIAAESKLARLLGVEPLEVVSRHHQALTKVKSPWRVCAKDEQGLIEAIEREDHPFAIGVQWHPELAAEGSRNDRLFQGLVGAAGMAAATKDSGRVLQHLP